MHRLLVGALLIALVAPLSAQASGIPTTATRIALLAPPSTLSVPETHPRFPAASN